MNFGLKQEPRELSAYIFGSSLLPIIPYREDGDWEDALPKYEPQAEKYETNGCTVWGTQNQIETFYNGLYGIEPNYAERFNYLLTPVNPRSGADPQRVYENIRKVGLINNRYLPIPDTLEEFLDEDDITERMYRTGSRWLEKNELKHEWLWTLPPKTTAERLEVMKFALRSSPLGVSVSAWFRGSNGKYIDNGLRNNHWCICYKIDDEGIHVFDSYDHSKKILDPNHYIHRAKRIWINKKQRRAMKKHVRLLEDILKNLNLMKKTLVDLAKEHIGTDASPADLAPDELGCAETVTTILKKLYPKTPIITGTWTLWDYFEKHPNWFPMQQPEPGCIIISPTGTGNGKFPGHVGIMLDDGTIASNDSFTGKFERNYDLDTWKARYQEKGGFPVYYYKFN